MYFPIIDVLKENFIAKIPSIVTQWLTDNVDPVGSAVVVDESLSISGAAADAKITGDEISDLKSDLNEVTERTGTNLLPVGEFSTTVRGVAVNYDNGVLNRNGTGSSSGGDAEPITPTFTLQAGTYTFSSDNVLLNAVHIVDASANTKLSTINSQTNGTFTISEDKPVYLSTNVVLDRQYNNITSYIQLVSGSSAGTWSEPSITAIDTVARTDISQNTADIAQNTADILYIEGGTVILEKESVSQMYNGSSELKTETDTLKFYKAEIPSGVSELTFAQESAGSNYAHWYNEFDENDNLLYAVTLTIRNTTDTITIHNPSTVSYVKISMWVANGSLALGYAVPSLIDEKISERIGASQYSYVSALGDSITNGLYYLNGAQAYTENTYQKLLADHFGAIFQKLGVNSTSISTQSNYESSTNAFVNRYTQISESADLIIIAGGTNDWGHNTPMGVIADTTDVGFYGALDVLINGLISHYPNARIVFVTPFHRNYSSGTYDPDTNQNGQGHTLKDYCDAIRQKCAQYGIQCVDGYAESGINKTTTCITNFAPDGLHPNPDGHAKIYHNLLHALM